MSDPNLQLYVSRIVSPYPDISRDAIKECAENLDYHTKPEVRTALTIASYNPQLKEIIDPILQKINSQVVV
jgi:hypothetical protein